MSVLSATGLSLNSDAGERRSGRYYPALDGLRGVAVLLVLAEHFTYSELIRGFSPGMIGVRAFFVLSGFLITGILLQDRQRTAPAVTIARDFYWRRFVRLSPALFIAVAATAILGVGGMRESWWVHLLYLSNFQVAAVQYWTDAAHFWTLAVEEQFYLLWFAAVVLAPRAWLLPTIGACLLISPLFRGAVGLGMSEFYAVLLPGQLDSLATGALAACAFHWSNLKRLDGFFLSPSLLCGSGGALIALIVIDFGPLVAWAITPILVNVFVACVVRRSAEGAGRVASLLAQPWLIHVGVISYGVYVYHYFVPQIWYAYVPGAELFSEEAPLRVARSLIWLVSTLAIAHASWWFIERPALRLKRLWRPAPAQAVAT